MDLLTTDLCDANEAALANGALRILAPLFHSYGGRRAFCGPITTLKIFEDNGLVRSTLESPGEGRVLVIDGGGSLRCAVLGDQLAALAVRNGWNGVLVNGCIRDSRAIGTMDLGVFALATHPQKTVKKNQGERDVSVSFGGATLRPGEWLYADEDGVIVSATRLHQ